MTRRPGVNKGGKVDFGSWFQRNHGRAASGYDRNPRGGRPGGTTHRMKLADTFKDLVISFCQESFLYPKSHNVPKQHHQLVFKHMHLPRTFLLQTIRARETPGETSLYCYWPCCCLFCFVLFWLLLLFRV